MVELPSIPEIVRRTKALAVLDLILSPEWQYRYYSFNAHWSSREQMASMRDGCGDEWWLVFHDSGWAALKGLGHESSAWSEMRETLSDAIRSALPPEVAEFAQEAAFRWDETSFSYFWLPTNGVWKRANDLTAFAQLATGEEKLLRHLCGTAADYADFAGDYYEADIPLDIVTLIFNQLPLTSVMVNALNADTTLEQIEEELAEIDYPIQK